MRPEWPRTSLLFTVRVAPQGSLPQQPLLAASHPTWAQKDQGHGPGLPGESVVSGSSPHSTSRTLTIASSG
jgi:hypothetical protein